MVGAHGGKTKALTTQRERAASLRPLGESAEFLVTDRNDFLGAMVRRISEDLGGDDYLDHAKHDPLLSWAEIVRAQAAGLMCYLDGVISTQELLDIAPSPTKRRKGR